MRMALYEPGAGYYRQGVRRIGRGGDFYTSVSVGPLFGALLAQHCHDVWQALGQPAEFVIIEQGAHDGTLARDILTALKTVHPELHDRARYLIIEPDATLQAAQRQTLGDEWEGRCTHVPDWQSLPSGLCGIVLCNELLDAFPVHRVVFRDGQWQEQYVALHEDEGFDFVNGPLSSNELQDELALLPGPFADGHITEINVDAVSWLREIEQSQFTGEILIADYGHAAPEYFAPERREGTLRRYLAHKSDHKVLESLGECDLTAHVNFTRVAEEALGMGWQVEEFIEQGRFLTRVATSIMKCLDFQPSASWLRQFQSLTHPSHLGHSFHVLTLSRGIRPRGLSSDEQRIGSLRRLGILAEHD
jgi:SAM-dependent MidA family methyltransferase